MSCSSRLRSWLWRLSLASLALVVGLALLETFVAERWWVTTLLTYAPQHPVPLLPALLFVIAAVLRQRRAAAVNGLGLALALLVLLGFRFPLRASAAGDPPVRVMTYNLERFQHGTPEQLRALAERAKVDVLCVQEANRTISEPTSPELLRAFAGWHQAVDKEMAIFSRDPILRQQSHPFPDTARPVLEAVICHWGQRVTILNVHFSVALLPKRVKEQHTTVPSYLRHTADVRTRQVAALLALARQADGPVLAVGDFNTPPRGLIYRQLTSQLTDGFAAAGLGVGSTYSARRPLLRIDYVFANGSAQFAQCSVLPERRLSDHLPLLAEVVVGRGADRVRQRSDTGR